MYIINDFNIGRHTSSLKSGIYNSDHSKPKFSLEEIREILTWMRPCDKTKTDDFLLNVAMEGK